MSPFPSRLLVTVRGCIFRAHEDAALADAVPGNVGVVLGTGTDVGEILCRVARHLSARTVGPAIFDEIARKAGENVLDRDGVGIKAVAATFEVAVGQALSPLPRLSVVEILGSICLGHTEED